MKLRTLLLIGSVSALTLVQAASAQEAPAQPILVAQADLVPLLEEEASRAADLAAEAAAAARDAEDAAKAANKEARRAERRAKNGDEADQQAANEAAARAEEALAAASAAQAAAEEAARLANEKAAALQSAASNAARVEQEAEKESAAQAAEAEAAERAARAAEEDAAAQAAKAAEEEAQKAAEDEARARKRAERKAKAAEEEAAAAARAEADRAAQQTPEAATEEPQQAIEALPEVEQTIEAAPEEEQPGMSREERRKKRRAEREAEQRAIDDAAAAESAPEVAPSANVAPTGQPDNLREKRRKQRERRREQLEAAPAAPSNAKPAASDASPVEQQIQIQRGSAEVEELRRLRRKLERERVRIENLQEDSTPEQVSPDQGGDAKSQRQRERELRRQRKSQQQPDTAENGRNDGDRRDRGEVVKRQGDRVIIRLGDQLVIQPNREGDRLLSGARDVEVEDLGNGRTRTTVFRDNGVRIVTLRDRHGDILVRTRVLPDGRRVVLIDNREAEKAPRRARRYGQIDPLPPFVLRIPRDQYIVETRRATRRQIQEALVAPPVERVERDYTLDEVRYSDRLREKVRRIDLDTITFAFGSAAVGLDQLDALDSVGQAIEDLVRRNPDEIFLIEGHTDAVGSDQANLVLSDERAEAVAVALSEDFDIPPENLVTQGYGEQQLKIATSGPERENRRVAIRRITPLLRASQ